MRVSGMRTVQILNLCLILLVDSGLADLIMIRHPTTTNTNGTHMIRFTCLSEDDGGALVIYSNHIDSDNEDFKTYSNTSVLEHPVVDPERQTQDLINWRIVTPEEIPLELDLDYQWEGFETINEFNISNPMWYSSAWDTTVASVKELVRYKGWYTVIRKWNGTHDFRIFDTFSGPKLDIMEHNIDAHRRSAAIKNLRWRPHTYSYFLATDTWVTMKTMEFNVTGQHLCFYLPIILCNHCLLIMSCVDRTSSLLIQENITASDTLTYGKLPDWKMVKVNWNLPAGYENPVKLVITTSTANETRSDHWAIGTFRQCGGPVQKIAKTFSFSSNKRDITCEKLYYEESSAVFSYPNISNVNSSTLDNCLQGVGLLCDFGCNASCSGTSICTSGGCTCAPGYSGADCTEYCLPNKYGYNCQKTCSCPEYHHCNASNGSCNPGPAPPINLSVTLGEKGIATLKWDYNPYSWEKLEAFEVQLKILASRLRNGPHPELKTSTIAKDEKLTLTCPTTNTSTASPINLNAIIGENGTVFANCRNGRYFWKRLDEFDVCVKIPSQNLKNNTATELDTAKMETAKELTLVLPTATEFQVNVKAMDQQHGNSHPSSKLTFQVPGAIRFTNGEGLRVTQTETSFDLEIPRILDCTNTNSLEVLVNKSTTCPCWKFAGDEDTSVFNMTHTDKGCVAKFRSTKHNGPEIITIGSPDCPLPWNESYLVEVTVSDDVDNVTDYVRIHVNKFEPRSYWIWYTILPISVACVVSLSVLHWKFKKTGTTSKISLIESTKTVPLMPVTEFDIFAPYPHREELMNFEKYVRRSCEDGVLNQQFSSLPRGLVQSCEYGKSIINKSKNRYGNLIPYDETRVILARGESDDPSADYINANYLKGYYKDKAYIATQAPMKETVLDFWRMIWQEDVRVICMLMDEVEDQQKMYEAYWPNVREEAEYGDITVANLEQKVSADYILRTFVIIARHARESRRVEHLHYTNWPDKGVPMYMYSVVEFLKTLLSIAPGQGPIVVHCNSGSGRTGTLILCDICLRCMAAEGTVDVFAEAKAMYRARANMLDNRLQYVLAHLIPLECLILLPSTIPCSEVSPAKIMELKNEIPHHIVKLEKSSWMDRALRPLEPLRPPIAANVSKNRFYQLTPAGPSLVRLKRCPEYDMNSDYISAVSVDGVKMKNQYLASQLPLPSTLFDFWRLVIEKNVELVVVLQQPDPDDKSCCSIIPLGTTLIPVRHVTVKTEEHSNTSKYFTTDKLTITDTSQKPACIRKVTVLTCNDWKAYEDAMPPEPIALVELWKASEMVRRAAGPTLSLCYNGVTGCGLYLALSFMLERMQVESKCDVILAVGAIRRSRQEFVRPEWQFHYLYDAAMRYVEMFEIYANFT